MSYYNKYLKYKQKYQKIQSGGDGISHLIKFDDVLFVELKNDGTNATVITGYMNNKYKISEIPISFIEDRDNFTTMKFHNSEYNHYLNKPDESPTRYPHMQIYKIGQNIQYEGIPYKIIDIIDDINRVNKHYMYMENIKPTVEFSNTYPDININFINERINTSNLLEDPIYHIGIYASSFFEHRLVNQSKLLESSRTTG